MHQKIKEEKCI